MDNKLPARIRSPPAARCKLGKDAPKTDGACNPSRMRRSITRGRSAAGRVTVELIGYGNIWLRADWLRDGRAPQDRKYAAIFPLTLIEKRKLAAKFPMSRLLFVANLANTPSGVRFPVLLVVDALGRQLLGHLDV